MAASPSSRRKSQDESFLTLSSTVSAEGNQYKDSSRLLSEGSNRKAPSQLSQETSNMCLSMQGRKTQGESPSKEVSLGKTTSILSAGSSDTSILTAGSSDTGSS